MRLVIWNCKGAFRRKYDFMAELRPDILVVPECEKFSDLTEQLGALPLRSREWIGDNSRKGLGVFSYGEYQLALHPNYASQHRWIVPLVVSGPVSFVLFAVWTKPVKTTGSYVQPLFEAFQHYKELINARNVIWAGDFNASYVFDKDYRQYKFRDFVSLLARHDLHSLYHHQRKCSHGEEPDKTFFLYHDPNRGFHIDYVFTRNELFPRGFNVTVGSHADWRQRSDHVPLVCEFLDPVAALDMEPKNNALL